MRCPVDDAPLREVTRRGVKIDLCSDCRGIWLDRGELEHLLEAAGAEDDVDVRAQDVRGARPQLDERRGEFRDNDRRDYDDRRRRDDDDDDRRGPRKKRSWLSEILEFGE